MLRDANPRSLVRTASWLVLSALATALLVLAFTEQAELAAAVGAANLGVTAVLLWVYERMWRIRPVVVWITGLPGSGKSTLAEWLTEVLRRKGHQAEHLDGEAIRYLFPRIGFTRPERDEHIRRVGYLASKLEEHGVFVVASFVSPYEESRDFVRRMCRRFVLVHVATPLEACERRDRKGLFAKARRGEISHFTGVDDPYEVPRAPDVTVDTSRESTEVSGAKVLAEIQRRSRR